MEFIAASHGGLYLVNCPLGVRAQERVGGAEAGDRGQRDHAGRRRALAAARQGRQTGTHTPADHSFSLELVPFHEPFSA